MQKHRISTDIGRDQFVKVELNQDFDLLEILSLKFTQKEVYASYCSDYGVVCGRISINNGLGVPNARVSIFIPLDETDSIDPVISTLYPYTSVTDRDENNYRYNLLPHRKQHGGHEPTGTFPDQSDILTREEVLEVYEKYYKYTVKTNDSGDFMIWGVPLGSQTIHVDVDLSDMGCFSLRPYDFLRLGYGEDQFKNSFSFKASEDIDSLPQIVRFDKTIEVYPLWGNESICEIGITRTDFDLSSIGVKLEPKAYLIGGVYTDTNKNSINKNCQVRRKMGRKCDLTTKTGKIEAIRFTHRKDTNKRPILEKYTVDEDIPEDGGFVFPIPMNTEFLYTNEFGENEITNDPNKGVPTASCYRFRFTLDDSGNDRVRKTASYLVPNIREHQTTDDEKEKSYAFSTDWVDESGYTIYPTVATSNDPDMGILYNVDGQYYPRDYFFRMTYNKVYTVSSFHSMYYHKSNFTNDRYIGLKELVPTEEEDCSDNVTPPVNYGTKNKTFQLLITEVVLFMEQLFNVVTLTFFNTIAKVFHAFSDAVDFWPIRRLARLIRKFAYRFQNSTQKQLFLINYPECEECNGDNQYGTGIDDPALGFCEVGTIIISGSTDEMNRTLSIYGGNFIQPSCPDADRIYDMADFVARQTSYIFTVQDSIGVSLSGSPISYSTTLSGYTFNDIEQIFPDSVEYTVTIRDKNHYTNPISPAAAVEEGCDLYDVPYNEDLISLYYTCDTGSRCPTTVYTPGMSVVATKLSDTTNYQLLQTYDGDVYEPITPSGYVEFSNGVFNVIPGSLSNGRLIRILREYRRRKRVGKLFCGGIVNYSFVENWMSGSLYFILFKGKKGKYCSDVIKYSSSQERYYYRSSIYQNGNFGTSEWNHDTQGTKYLGRPTTIVDLGPRDEFIKEICTDPSLDPNCSVARSIGATSFQSFGDILGLAINYRMDVSDNDYDINQFFGNNGFNLPNQRVLSGDILQLISINNETGIEEFDLQNTRYLGYSYQYLDPDNPTTKTVFFANGVYGPLPITFYLDEDGERVRACINEPGRLDDSAQKVPFFLWDKKGTGFGPYNVDTLNDQSWYYSVPQIQPLQGMTFNYMYNNDDKYLLLPITYNFGGLSLSTSENATNDVDFDIIGNVGEHYTYSTKYPGFTVLEVTSGTIDNPTAGQLYTRIGTGWDQKNWTKTNDFVIRATQDYYNGNRQILSTPFMFYFGLKSGKTGLDKFIKHFGDKNDFTTAE